MRGRFGCCSFAPYVRSMYDAGALVQQSRALPPLGLAAALAHGPGKVGGGVACAELRVRFPLDGRSRHAFPVDCYVSLYYTGGVLWLSRNEGAAAMPDVPAQPHTVFVSHAHADNELADQYVEALRKRGLDVWYDRTNMQVGHFLSQDIETQLRSCTALVLLITPASLASYWVRLEVGAFQSLAAQDPARLLLPVRIAECEMPLLMMGIMWIDAVSLGFDAAIDALAKALRASNEHSLSPAPAARGSVEELLKQGSELIAQNKYAEAIPSLELATQLDPHSFQAWRNLGRAYIETGRDKDGLMACNRALALDDKQAWVWCSKGRVLYRLKRNDEALAACEQALALDPNLAVAWETKAEVLWALGRVSEGDAAFQCARELGWDW
jgi:tetratricopeptide (TPR) repeat protein